MQLSRPGVLQHLTAQQVKDNAQKAISLLKESGVPEEFIDWLKTTDYFKAPASTMYHSVYVGGLCDHSLGVYEWFLRLISMKGIDPETISVRPAVVALLHDLCKVGVYHQEMKRVKVDGRWIDQLGWVFKEEYPMGHGEKSLALCLEKGISLTRSEMLAIRYHMGPYTLQGNDLRSYQSATQMEPAVFLLHTADMLESLYGRIERS